MSGFVCYDHLGNEFENKTKMCEHYGVKKRNFEKRISRGWSLKRALTEVSKKGESKLIKDPIKKNVYYHSFVEMAKAYEMNVDTLTSRLELGWDLKDALLRDSRKKQITDHVGNVFKTQKDLCDFYGISRRLYYRREKNGWSIEEILTTPFADSSKFVVDKYRNIFITQLALCKHYGVHRESDGYKSYISENQEIRVEKVNMRAYTKNDVKLGYEKNKELFWKSHEITTDEKGNKYLVCKLCGFKRNITNVSEELLTRIIARIDGLDAWCSNSCCVNSLSNAEVLSSGLDEVSTTNMIYIHKHRQTGRFFYHFTCPYGDLDDLMTFEEIVEHLSTHVN